MPFNLFVLNPGSTSTKTALFQDGTCLFEETVRHPADEIKAAGSLLGQLPLRLAAIEASLARALTQAALKTNDLAAIVGRGGLLRGIPGGTYRVSADMLDDLTTCRYGEHASNLGALIADKLAARFGIGAFIVDPPSVDEMADIARFSGLPRFRRRSIFHALNQKAVARLVAAEMGRPYEQLNLIVTHMGGGITVGAHCLGRVIDVNDALEEGPFTPERAGSLPTRQLVDCCFAGQLTRDEVRRMLVGEGGLYAYTGSTDCREIIAQAGEHPEYLAVVEAMAYQVAKEIGAMSTVLAGRVDAIILTGGLAHSSLITGHISQRVAHLAPICIHPGEDELAALAGGGLRVLQGSEQAQDYQKIIEKKGGIGPC